ncbi:MAG: hypothetical protein R3D29_13585, partial [Nitratireductor sp.]
TVHSRQRFNPVAQQMHATLESYYLPPRKARWAFLHPSHKAMANRRLTTALKRSPFPPFRDHGIAPLLEDKIAVYSKLTHG